MGSKTFEGVRFSVFTNDHHPPHVHGTASNVTVVVDLLGEGKIRLSTRARTIIPPNASRNVVAKIVRVAVANVEELEALWEKTHGSGE